MMQKSICVRYTPHTSPVEMEMGVPHPPTTTTSDHRAIFFFFFLPCICVFGQAASKPDA
jgi:hypothetical protein